MFFDIWKMVKVVSNNKVRALHLCNFYRGSGERNPPQDAGLRFLWKWKLAAKANLALEHNDTLRTKNDRDHNSLGRLALECWWLLITLLVFLKHLRIRYLKCVMNPVSAFGTSPCFTESFFMILHSATTIRTCFYHTYHTSLFLNFSTSDFILSSSSGE